MVSTQAAIIRLLCIAYKGWRVFFFFQAFFSQLFAFFLFEANNLEHLIKKKKLDWLQARQIFLDCSCSKKSLPSPVSAFPTAALQGSDVKCNQDVCDPTFRPVKPVLLRMLPLQYSNFYCRPPQTPPECRPVPELTSSSEASASSRRRWSRRKVQRRRSSPCRTQWSRSDQRAYLFLMFLTSRWCSC